MTEICKVKILNEEYTAYDITEDNKHKTLPKDLPKMKMIIDEDGNWNYDCGIKIIVSEEGRNL